jgi:YD repeat-containing protein
MKIISILFTFLTISTAFARADVSLRNGNFYSSFRDITYPGGLEPKIERIYNSKSDYRGMFGYSWGSDYETRLRIDPDGSLVIAEGGGGADNRFISKNFKAADLESGITQLVDAGKKSGLVSSAKQVADYRNKLGNDIDYRSKQYNIFVNKGLVPRRLVTEGSQFTSTHFLYQYITKVKGGYVRVLEGGGIQKFNEAGKLVQIMDRNKNFINLAYDKNSHMIQLIDNQNRKMVLTYNAQNLVDKIVGESGKNALYKYTTEGLMNYSRDEDGIENTYKYTTDVYRNLTEIGFPKEKDAKGQSKKMSITYYGADKNQSVKSVTNPDGTVNEYDYHLKDNKNPDYYAVRVLLKEPNGTRISDSKYEYFSKLKPGGETFTSRMISTIDGDKTDTTYDEKLGFPTKIVNNGRITTMDYDVKGRMIKKASPLEVTKLEYDPGVGKVSKVTRILKSGTQSWSAFTYDKATSNLVLAKNSDKKTVKLVYDQTGHIRALIDQTGRQLTFKYNELSKPVEISDAKLGTVKFTYKNSGEVDKVDSNGGANVATEVMRALQGLIDITAPAGVTMSI